MKTAEIDTTLSSDSWIQLRLGACPVRGQLQMRSTANCKCC